MFVRLIDCEIGNCGLCIRVQVLILMQGNINDKHMETQQTQVWVKVCAGGSSTGTMYFGYWKLKRHDSITPMWNCKQVLWSPTEGQRCFAAVELNDINRRD